MVFREICVSLIIYLTDQGMLDTITKDKSQGSYTQLISKVKKLKILY